MSQFVLRQERLEVPGYEKVIRFTEEEVGLDAIIAIHNTKLGPALGGVRVFDYADFDSALHDVLRLAKGMTYKSAVAQTGTGGGKSVIIASHAQKTPELLQAFGEAVESLAGEYICAEDIGMTAQDLHWVRQKTRHVVGLMHHKSSGDPSRFTTRGAFLGIQFVANQLWNGSLEGKTVAIQGLGATGMKLVETLFWEKAHLIVTDLSEQRCEMARQQFGAQVVEPDEILFESCDILAPCAMGGVITPEVVTKLKCQAICGIANNQLLTDDVAKLLYQHHILYMPDFIVNSGGLINVCIELEKQGYCPSRALKALDAIERSLHECQNISVLQGINMHQAALMTAENHLAQGSVKDSSICYHH